MTHPSPTDKRVISKFALICLAFLDILCLNRKANTIFITEMTSFMVLEPML